MSKKQKIIISILILAALVFLYIFIEWWKVRAYEKRNGLERVNLKGSVEDILYYENGQGEYESSCYIMKDEFNLAVRPYLGGYVCLGDFKYRKSLVYVHDISKARVDVYDMNQGKILRSMDIKELTEQYQMSSIESWYEEAYIYTDEKGKKYLTTEFTAYDGYTEYFHLDIETGKLVFVDYSRDNAIEEYENNGMTYPPFLESEEEARSKELYILTDKKIGLLEKNGLEIRALGNNEFLNRDIVPLEWGKKGIKVSRYYNIGGVVKVQVQKYTLPKENKLLYAQFPGLRDYEGDDSEFVTFYFSGYPTGEEILSMFLEEGQEISFEGCVLPAESSIDGQEHEINSFEDYYQWKNWDKHF